MRWLEAGLRRAPPAAPAVSAEQACRITAASVVEGDEDGDGISEHFVPTAGDAFIGGVDQAIAGVDSVVDEAFASGFIDLLGR